MRNEAMEQLDVLAGAWRTTLSNAAFLEPPAWRCGDGNGRVAVGRLPGLPRTMTDDAGNVASEMVLVLGRSDAHDSYTALYHDERGARAGLRHDLRRLALDPGPEDPDMLQRFVAEVEADRIVGRWEASDDRGATWRKDFDLVLKRA